MPRARISNASLIASADALILPWLAPRAFAAAPALRRRERHNARSSSVQKEHVEVVRGDALATADEGSSCRQWQPRTRTTQPSQPSSPAFTLGKPPTRTRAPTSLHLRYADIATFARQYTRSYTTSVDSNSQALHRQPQNTSAISEVASASRYSRRRSWKAELAKQAKEVTPERAGRLRLKHIALAEQRLNRQVERLQRDASRYKNKLVYDGQYRSLQRLIINLKRWNVTEEDLTKVEGVETDEEWLLRVFAALERSTYVRVHTLTNPLTLSHSRQTFYETRLLLDGIDGDENVAERMWFNWHNLGEKKQYYDHMLLYLLDKKPGLAQDFLTVLAADESLPQTKFVIMADALAHLAKLHVKGEYPHEQGWEASPEANSRKFITTFHLCTRYMNTAVYSQDLIHSLILLADKEDLKKTYDVLIEWHTRLSAGTTLHLASAFGEAGEHQYALRCLETRFSAFNQTERELWINSERFRWTCATILRGSMREAKDYHQTPGIVATFVEWGVKMDLLLYDVVMRNAMEAGDFATAFKVYNTLDANGLVPDKYTFSIMLHGCTMQSDPAMFNAFAELCLKKAKELEDPWLATDCLYYTYTCEHNKDSPGRNAGPVWRTYFDLFDKKPLEPFLRNGSRALKDALVQQTADPTVQKLAPTPMAIYLMLQTEVQTAQFLGVGYLERLYATFKRAVSAKEAHSTLATLAQTPIMWNTFLYAFCQKTQYASASAVIKDMTAYGTLPNVYSWNMFMQSFFKTSQVAAADRVFEIMHSRGIKPDAYTYGIMVRGYAKAQLVDRIGETMQHVSEEEQLDPQLLRMLGQVQARADLTAALEKRRIAKETRDTEAAERKAKEEEKRFEPPRFASLLTNALRFREAKHWDNGPANDDFMEPDDEDSKSIEADHARSSNASSPKSVLASPLDNKRNEDRKK